MNKSQLNTLLEPFGLTSADLEYDYPGFYTKETTYEGCPYCADDVIITQDGKSDCPECGRKEVLPCSQCPLMDMQICDWTPENRCSAFPKKGVTA